MDIRVKISFVFENTILAREIFIYDENGLFMTFHQILWQLQSPRGKKNLVLQILEKINFSRNETPLVAPQFQLPLVAR